MGKSIGLFMFVMALTAFPAGSFAAEETMEKEKVYGYQLMTEQELIEHRTKLRSLKTPKERQAYRMEHHKKMQARAKERGVTLAAPKGFPESGAVGGPGPGGEAGGGAGAGAGGKR